jgi:hypothetical protein
MDDCTTNSARDYDSMTSAKTPIYIEEDKCKSLQGSRQNTPFNLASADPNSQLRNAIGSAIESMKAEEAMSWTALDGSLDVSYSPLLVGSAVPTPVDLGFIPITADPTPMMALGQYSLPDSSRLAQALGSLSFGSQDVAGEVERKIPLKPPGSFSVGLHDSVGGSGALRLPDPLCLPQWSPGWPGVGYMPLAESSSRQVQDIGRHPYADNVLNPNGEESRLLSIGSQGHPVACGPACKYAWKTRGCKEGLQCARCHLCLWTRESMRRVRQNQ